MADGLLDRLGASLRALVGVYGPNAASQAYGLLTGILPGGRGELSPRGTTEFLKAYSESPWLRAVVQKVAHGVATTEWQLYVETSKPTPGAGPATGKAVRNLAFQRDADWRRRAIRRKDLEQTGNLKQLDTHPMLDLLNSTNSFLTGLMTRQLTQVYLDLVGEVFWLKERKTKTGPAIAIWPIPPTWVYATPTPVRPYFEVRFRGWQVEIPDTEMLWMADPNPLNPYGRGSGMTHALGDELDTDEFAARHTKLWFQNRARPDLLVAMEGANPEEIKRLEADWLAKSQGFWRAFKPYFLSGKGNVTIKELSQTFENMQLVPLRQFERDMIMQVYGVSPEIMGVLANSNRATITAADYMFARWVLTPRLEFQRAFLQERLAPEFDERLIVDYASPIQRDEDFELAVAVAAPWSRTVDEWRDLQHLPPLPNGQGKVHMVPNTLVAVDDISKHEPPPPSLFGPASGGKPALGPGGKPAELPPGKKPPAEGSQPPAQKPQAASWSTPAGTPAARAQWRGVAQMLQKAQGHDGFMVALWVPQAAAEALALPPGPDGYPSYEPPDQLHCTLAYCGPYRHLDPGAIGDALAALDALAADHPPLTGTISGYGRFQASSTSGDKDVFYAAVDVPGLAELRQAVVQVLAAHGVPASTIHGFTPHVTLAYVPPEAPNPEPAVPTYPLHFDALTLALGDTHLSVPLSGVPAPPALPAPVAAALPAGPTKAEPHVAPSDAEIAGARAWWRETVAPHAGLPADLLDARPTGSAPGKAFNPDQPRDEQGRWTSDGGGGAESGGGHAPSSAPPAQPIPLVGSNGRLTHELSLPKQSGGAILPREREDTLHRFQAAPGSFVPERAHLHDQWVQTIKDHIPPSPEPVAYFMGGGTASGKSTYLDSPQGKAEIPVESSVVMDPDVIKGMIPEYKAMVAARDPLAAHLVHEESSVVGKRVVAEAARERRQLVLDQTHAGPWEKTAAKVADLRAQGYKVHASFATLPVEKAIVLATERGKKTGRVVDEQIIRESHRGVAQAVPKFFEHHTFDSLKLYDTDIYKQPRLVASQVDGQEMVVHDRELYATFVAKGR